MHADYLTEAQSEFERFDAYSRTELPRFIRQHLERAVDALSVELEPALKEELICVMLETQTKVLESYKALHSTQDFQKLLPVDDQGDRDVCGLEMWPSAKSQGRENSKSSKTVSSNVTDRALEGAPSEPASPFPVEAGRPRAASVCETQDSAMARHDSAFAPSPSLEPDQLSKMRLI